MNRVPLAKTAVQPALRLAGDSSAGWFGAPFLLLQLYLPPPEGVS